jgi:hypothetical protein
MITGRCFLCLAIAFHGRQGVRGEELWNPANTPVLYALRKSDASRLCSFDQACSLSGRPAWR